MLEPSEEELPFIFLYMVVLPLVAYFLLGKWGESSNRRNRINILAKLASEEALRVESMAAAVDSPSDPIFMNEIHLCARCSSPATTRCASCKSVRYCSGTCQIMHWRLSHKWDCQFMDFYGSSSSPESSVLLPFEHGDWQNPEHKDFSDSAWCETGENGSFIDDKCGKFDKGDDTIPQRWSANECVSERFDKAFSRQDDFAFDYIQEGSDGIGAAMNSFNNFHAVNQGDFTALGFSDFPLEQDRVDPDIPTTLELPISLLEKNQINSQESQACEVSDTAQGSGISCGSTTVRGIGKIKRSRFLDQTLSRASGLSNVAEKGVEHSPLICQGRRQLPKVLKKPKLKGDPVMHRGNEIVSNDVGKMKSFNKPKKVNNDSHPRKSMQALFPYEEYVKIFSCQSLAILPRGLINCGNSCYANAVLQCLTVTKPLIMLLLRGSHSRTCFKEEWCLMCEFEEHVMLLEESGDPLSLDRILLHIKSISQHIGDGSQEDAHEFLRLLVGSMQSVCLQGTDSEKMEPNLQETTFIQYTFGGSLRSKVKCLRCHYESERCENIMDLTLEIHGWVESLEDALTQFTTPEDLEGENMYRCERCSSYVRARKQLRIRVAPNVLTIALKRFREGEYGKISKCVSFPENLDMIPYMTGSDDVPPLYALYAVVVHLDTCNESFAGHYVAYVKDHGGVWLRIDDTEISPVSTDQVMSEEAYILFYIRSHPRPAVFKREEDEAAVESTIRRRNRASGLRENPQFEFADATSSDCSLFTSSDEASLTTDSARDSFSTADCSDAGYGDSTASIFGNSCASERPGNLFFCRKTSSSGCR